MGMRADTGTDVVADATYARRDVSETEAFIANLQNQVSGISSGMIPELRKKLSPVIRDCKKDPCIESPEKSSISTPLEAQLSELSRAISLLEARIQMLYSEIVI